MKKGSVKEVEKDTGGMRSEYDFTSGVRGKHSKAFRQGYTVKIHQPDGTVVVQRFEPDKSAVVLEADVRKYFPNSEAVNSALRSLIALIPGKRKDTVKKSRIADKGRSAR